MAKPPVKKEDKEPSEPESVVNEERETTTQELMCGIIMPIADMDGYPAGHWVNVKDIICEASKEAGFKANLVSSDDDVAVIQKRIVQNIYDNPVVVCDISARNANVMFELGMRLAFDKPTVIIKDERTPYSFDISSIEHLEYPSDLRYHSINAFKDKLAIKIKETYNRSISDPNYTTFLKHFGKFTVAQLDQKEVTEAEYFIAEIKELKSFMASLVHKSVSSNSRVSGSESFSSKWYPVLHSGDDPEKNAYDRNRILLGGNGQISIYQNGVAQYVVNFKGDKDTRENIILRVERFSDLGIGIERIMNLKDSVVVYFKSPLTIEESSEFRRIILGS